MMGRGTAAPRRRYGRVSDGPGGKTAPGVERPGGAPGGERRGVQRPRSGPEAQAGVEAQARLNWAGKVIAVALALGMLISPALWLSRGSGASLEDSFPQVPPLPGMEILALPAPLDTGLLGLVLALCALAVALPGRRLVLGALLGALLLIALPDLLRWQPWVLVYVLAFATLVLPGHSGARMRVTVLRIIVASVYLYSGLNKVNAAFFSEGLREFLTGLPRIVSSGPVAAGLTFSAPALEIAAGAGLLLGMLAGFTWMRYAALGLAVSTNLFVLTALVAAGANQAVWPWNAAMIALAIILFARQDEKEGRVPRPGPPGRTSGNVAALREAPGRYGCALVIVALAAVMPAAGVAGYWPSYLSWALYSENTQAAMVNPPGPEEPSTAAALAYDQLGVPAYPARAVYLELGKKACDGREVVSAEAPGGSGAVLTVESRPGIRSGDREVREYRCPG